MWKKHSILFICFSSDKEQLSQGGHKWSEYVVLSQNNHNYPYVSIIVQSCY